MFNQAKPPGDPEWSPPLSGDEFDSLSNGAEVYVLWQGGNGPYKYTVRRPDWEDHPLIYLADVFVGYFEQALWVRRGKEKPDDKER